MGFGTIPWDFRIIPWDFGTIPWEFGTIQMDFRIILWEFGIIPWEFPRGHGSPQAAEDAPRTQNRGKKEKNKSGNVLGLFSFQRETIQRLHEFSWNVQMSRNSRWEWRRVGIYGFHEIPRKIHKNSDFFLPSFPVLLPSWVFWDKIQLCSGDPWDASWSPKSWEFEAAPGISLFIVIPIPTPNYLLVNY